MGYIFLIIDTRGESAHVEVRQWQEHEFTASRFSDISPDTWAMTAGVTNVTAPEQPLAKGTGVIHLSAQSADESVLSAAVLKEELEKGDMTVSGITVTETKLSADGKTVEITYTTTAQGQQPIPVTVQVDESGTVKGLSQPLKVYPRRETSVTVAAAEKQEDLPKFGEFNAYAELKLTTSPAQTNVEILEQDSSVVINQTAKDSVIIVNLLPGTYLLSGTKTGWQEGNLTLTIPNQQPVNARLELVPVPVAATVAGASEGAKVGKAKWWILGAAAVLIGGGAALLLLDSESYPGIPIPPGRPIGFR